MICWCFSLRAPFQAIFTSEATGTILSAHALAPRPGNVFFNDTSTSEIYSLSIHDALPISQRPMGHRHGAGRIRCGGRRSADPQFRSRRDPQSTRLHSSHQIILYAVFCLKKKSNSHVCFIVKPNEFVQYHLVVTDQTHTDTR